jgi:glycine betaine/proline transport system substrate-binding protein
VQWDQKLIDNLGLDFTVVFAGSEDAEMKMLDDAYAARAPMLFYFWSPHWVFAKHDLTFVKLPPYDATLWSEQKCGYPSDPLFKIVWPDLETYAPEAYAFFKAFSYTEQDQVQMMKSVHDGATVDQAARDWITTHESVWRSWIPAAR